MMGVPLILVLRSPRRSHFSVRCYMPFSQIYQGGRKSPRNNKKDCSEELGLPDHKSPKPGLLSVSDKVLGIQLPQAVC